MAHSAADYAHVVSTGAHATPDGQPSARPPGRWTVPVDPAVADSLLDLLPHDRPVSLAAPRRGRSSAGAWPPRCVPPDPPGSPTPPSGGARPRPRHRRGPRPGAGHGPRLLRLLRIRRRPGRLDPGRAVGRSGPARRLRLVDHRRPGRSRTARPGRSGRAGRPPVRRRRPQRRAVDVRRRRRRGRASPPATWRRSSWPATSSPPPPSRSTSAGRCAGSRPATRCAGPSTSTACSGPRRRCSCAASAAWSPHACWPAPSAVPATTSATSPSPRPWRARRRTSRSTSTPSARSPTRWSRTAPR